MYRNGFPKYFVLDCVSRVLNGFYVPKIPIANVPRKEIMMVIPYLVNMSIVLKARYFETRA